MGALHIDWQKLYEATSTSNKPTPGYLFNEIVHDVSHCHPHRIQAVADYLADCVDGDHAHVKLKALFVIKTVAYRVPPFCGCMQERLSSVEAAAAFSGPPSALYGDEPYRLVREAADGALQVLVGGAHFHEQYRGMSQRIVGFGNYMPGEDTVLPDGSVDVGVTYRDVLSIAYEKVSGGVSSVFGGVKDLLASGVGGGEKKLEGLDIVAMDLSADVEDDAQNVASGMHGGAFETSDGVVGDEARLHSEEGYEEEADEVDVESYKPSAGDYVPPALPMPKSVETRQWEDLWASDEAAVPDLLGFGRGTSGGIGVGNDLLGDEPLANKMPCEDEDFSAEENILHVLGLSEPGVERTDGRMVREVSSDAHTHNCGNGGLMERSAFGFLNCAAPLSKGEAPSPLPRKAVGSTAGQSWRRSRPQVCGDLLEV